MDQKQLHVLITRYFDGETTAAEERELRRELAVTDMRSPLIDEARAVTGYFAACGAARRVPRATVWPRVAAAAVIAVMIVSVTVGVVPRHMEATGSCIAYVGGTTVTDGDMVQALVSEQLALMGEAAEAVESDVRDDLRNVFDLSVDGID